MTSLEGRAPAKGTHEIGDPMNTRFAAAVAMLAAAIIFLILGLRAVPRDNTYVVLGIVFAIFAAARFRRARTP